MNDIYDINVKDAEISDLYVDFDGTMAVFKKGIGPDTYSKKGYSRGLDALENVVNALIYIIEHGLMRVHVFSAVMPFDYVVDDKNWWIDNHNLDIPNEYRHYLPYGQSKAEYLKSLGIKPGDIILDDFNDNLFDVLNSLGGIITPVKLVNDINDGSKEWTGARVHYMTNPRDIALTLYGLSLATKSEEKEKEKDAA